MCLCVFQNMRCSTLAPAHPLPIAIIMDTSTQSGDFEWLKVGRFHPSFLNWAPPKKKQCLLLGGLGMLKGLQLTRTKSFPAPS